MRPQSQMQFGPVRLMQMVAPQKPQGPSMGEAIGSAASSLAGAMQSRSSANAWQGALAKASPNPEAPVSTQQLAPPPLMPKKSFSPLAIEQLMGSIGYGG